jgi:Helix-turn-helix of insertion element transposase
MYSIPFPQIDSRLNSRQIQAVEMVLQERSDQEIASAIGVRRETVNIWRNHNEAFQAAVQARLDALTRLEKAKILLSTVVATLQEGLVPGTEHLLLQDLPISVDRLPDSFFKELK